MSTTTTRRRSPLFAKTASSPPPPRGLRRWWLPAAAVLLFLWFLPAIVARTPVVRWVIDAAAADLNGQVTVESVSLGWLSPVRVRGASLTDEHRQPVLEVPRAESSRTLTGLLINRSRLGTFRLSEPKLAVAMQGGTSNVEQVLAEYFKPSDAPPSRLDLILEIVDGAVTVTDVERAQSWSIDKLQLDLRVPAGAEPWELTASGIVADLQEAGRFEFAMQMPPAGPDAPGAESAAADGASGQAAATDIALRFESELLPLGLLNPLVRRFEPGARVDGRLTTEIEAVLVGMAAPPRRLKAKATARDFQLALPAFGRDRLELAHLAIEAEASAEDTKLVINRSTIECDLGQAALTGTVDLVEGARRALPGRLAAQPFELEGTVDLARLAAMLPDTLQLRPGMKVTSGQVHVALRSEPADAGMTWQGQLTSSELRATDGGREVAWEQPVLLNFAAQQTPDGTLAGELRCRSDFLQMHAVGTTRQVTADASFNLDRLAEQLGQFVDLGSLRLAGDGWSRFAWTHAPGGAFAAEIELHVNRLHVALPNRQPWREPELAVSASASGYTDFGAGTQVETAALHAAAGTERIEARLLQPVLDLAGGGTWPIELHMQGELAHWPPRLALLYDLRDYPVAGRYEWAGQLIASPTTTRIAGAVLRVDALDCTLPGLRVVEPQAQLDLNGTWDHEAGAFTLAQSTLRTTSLAAATDDLAVTWGAAGAPELRGTLAYQGHLYGIQRWFTDPAQRPPWYVDGRLSGTARFDYSSGTTHGEVEAEVENLQVSTSEGRPFRDPRVRLAGRGSYDSATHSVVLDGLKIQSNALAVEGSGGADLSGDDSAVRFDGQMQYDMQQLSTLLQPYVGSGVELIGRQTSPLSFQGPLDLARARGSGALAWQQGDVYGFGLGPGELELKLAGGVLAAEPLTVAVNQGRVHLDPVLRLAPGPMTLTLPPGPLATEVQITPAMCASALKFVAPVLAGVTTAQGAFSIELDRCRVPLDRPGDAELAGRLIVHSVEVGPGPLVRELAVLLQREAPARLRRESVVPFHMTAGRVHHEELELIFPDVTIRTRGSVGLDQSLWMVASMPVPPKWLTTDTLRVAFEGQEVRIPVGGTLSAPRLDRAELDRWNRRVLEHAAQNVIRDQMDRGLDRLFGPR